MKRVFHLQSWYFSVSFAYALSLPSERLEQANNIVTSLAVDNVSRKFFRVFHLQKKVCSWKFRHIFPSVSDQFSWYMYISSMSVGQVWIGENRFYWVPKWLWKMTFFGLKYGQDLTGRPRPPPSPPRGEEYPLALSPSPLQRSFPSNHKALITDAG